MKICGQRTIVDIFEENAGNARQSPFIRFDGSDYSYGDVSDASALLAETLQGLGIGHGSRVALAIGNRPAFLVAFLGILSCGATAVPLNTLYKPDEIRYALEHAQCQAVATEEALAETVSEACRLSGLDIAMLLAGNANETRFTQESGSTAGQGDARQASRPVPGDIAGIFYTSGTTARPKGVMISHENMMYSAEVTIKSLGLGSSDVPLLAFPLFHVNSLFYGVLSAIVLQGEIGLAARFSVSGYWRDAVQAGATWTPGITGPLVQLLLDQDKSGIETQHSMRFAVGGNFGSLDQVRAFRDRFGITLLPGWSMTETVSLGTLHPIARPTSIPVVTGIGYPTLGQQVRLVRDDGSTADTGEPGEILYHSPSMFAGYLDDAAATRAAFTQDGWLRTGDVACMDGNGYMAFVDRKKEMIKTRGENVAAAEVERALNEHPGVAESAAVGVPETQGIQGERIEAYVVRDGGLEPGEDELLSWVGERVADFKVPEAIHFTDRLPKTPLGKIQRQKLRAG